MIRNGGPLGAKSDNICVDNFRIENEPLAISDPEAGRADGFRLQQNYPNPFDPVTTVAFEIRYSELVKLIIYDLSGRQVRSLINNRMEGGTHSVAWDGTDNAGKEVTSGMYFYRLQAGSIVGIKKMLLIC